MSIIERALLKARGTTADAPPKPAPERGPEREVIEQRPVVVAPTPPPTQSIRVESVPARGEPINIDLAGLIEAGILPPRELASQLAAQYRRIKWPVLDAALGKNGPAAKSGNLVMVTSSLPGEGKTFTSFNLALGIAQERDCTVLFVDGDVAKAHVTRVLGLSGHAGLLDLLANKELVPEDVVVSTDIPNLKVLPAGRANPLAPELIVSRRTEALFHDLSARYPRQLVVIDSPPLLLTNEAQVLARHMGQILVVVRANHTPQSALQEALSFIDRTRAVACILNQADSGRLFEDYYGYSEYEYGERTEPSKK